MKYQYKKLETSIEKTPSCENQVQHVGFGNASLPYSQYGCRSSAIIKASPSLYKKILSRRIFTTQFLIFSVQLLIALECFLVKKSSVLAQSPAPAEPVSLPAATSTESFPLGKYLTADGQNTYLGAEQGIAVFIIRIINFLALVIGSVAFLSIVLGGITLLTSAGNENQLTKGKDMILYAVIGLAVALLAYFITDFVQNIFYEIQA